MMTEPAQTLAWTPDRLIHYPLVEHVHLAPDGSQVLFTQRVAYLTDDASEFRQQTFVAPAQSGAARALTHQASAAQPRWSPDGQRIAFLRPLPNSGKPGLWIMPAAGGEPWPLTGAENGIRNAVTLYQWSPDGSHIAFVSVPWDEAEEARRRARDDARQWRVDYAFAHLYVAALPKTPGPAVEVRRVTHGRIHIHAFDWRPDGAEIALIHQPTPYLDTWADALLATVAVDGSSVPTLVTRGAATAWNAGPCYSPDGVWVACEVADEDRAWPYASRIHLYAADGGSEAPAPKPLADVSDNQPKVVGWSPDGLAVYALNQRGLGAELLALPIDGGAPRVLVAADRLIGGCHVNRRGQAALVRQDFHQPDAVEIVNLTDAQTGAPSAPQPVIMPAADYPTGPLPQVRLLNWRTPDGYTIEGILYLPQGYEQARDGRIPLLLHIHGGPMSIFQRQYAGAPYYYAPAALCEQGIAVLRCNPRGSGGYGRAFRYANLPDWGGGDYRDLMQGVDTVIEQGIADPARLGVAGWSYGGYMASWIITQTDRFAAASIGAPVTNPISFTGTADIPSFVPGFFGGEFWERWEYYVERTPLFHAHQVHTPALIQHGDADERVPLEQGLQYYMALERRGVPVEMVIYPRQGHAIAEPRLLADAIRRNLAWFTDKLAPTRPA
ncbi:MAG: S9 family peptidase [Caldilineaceae bacterium]|nr:S9 family peptidase [Caldilineaceae bacterium]